MTPGLHACSLAEYLADPAPEPSLNASTAHALLAQSPKHAWSQSKRLNPALQAEESEAFDLGTAAHAYLLEGETGFLIIEAKDFRTQMARDARDTARAAGKTPLLAHRWAAVQAMTAAIRQQLAAHDAPVPFTRGQPEQTLIWQEGDVWCRARLDWLHDGFGHVDDLKTTQATAHPAAFSRRIWDAGYDLQAALYTRGVKAVLGVEPEFRFVVAEVTPPYGVSVVSLDPEALAFATTKLDHAIARWGECLRTDTWPGYPARTAFAEVPPWAQAQWMERAYYEEAKR